MNAPIAPEDIPHIVHLRKETGPSWPAIAQRYGRPPSHGPTFAHAVARALGPKTTPRARTKRLRALEEQSTPATRPAYQRAKGKRTIPMTAIVEAGASGTRRVAPELLTQTKHAIRGCWSGKASLFCGCHSI